MSPRARKQDWMDGIPHLLSLSLFALSVLFLSLSAEENSPAT